METYDFYATSKESATKKMEAVIRKHYRKYWKMLHIENLWLINHNLRRAILSY